MGKRDEAVKALKSAFVTLQTRAVMAALVSYFPFILKYPSLYKLIEKYVKQLLGKTADETEIRIFFEFIDVRANKQGVEFEQYAILNWKVQNSDASQEEKNAIEDALFIKFKSFAKFTT